MTQDPKRTFQTPDFLVVGTTKSGTTSLQYYLNQHPNIFLPSIKETWFFSILNNPNKVILDLFPELPTSFPAYLSHFEDARPDQVCGEITPTYLHYHHVAIPNIKKFLPNYSELKIIIILREPVDKILSEYRYVCNANLDPDQLSLWESLQQEEKRRKSHAYISNVFYVDGTSYYHQVKAYLEAFKHVKIILFDDYKANPKSMLEEIYEFIGVQPIHNDFKKKLNKSYPKRIPRNKVAKWIVEHKNYFRKLVPLPVRLALERTLQKDEQIEPEAIEYLKKVFHPEVLKLQDLIDRDLSHWIERYPQR